MNPGRPTVTKPSGNASPDSQEAQPLVYDEFEDAYREAQRRRLRDLELGMFTRVERCPYGRGFVVRSVPNHMLTKLPMAAPFYPTTTFGTK